MADEFLPPIVAKLSLNIDDFLAGLDRAKAALTSFAAEAESIGNIELKLSADTDGLREQVARASKEASVGEEIKLPVEAEAVDLDRLQATGEKVTVPIDLDSGGLREKTDVAVKEAQAGQQIEVPVHVDDARARAEGARAGNAAGDGFKDAFKTRTIDIIPGAGVFRVPIELIIPGLADLGQLTGVLGLIPAMFTTAATAAATFKVGMTDVTNAVTAYQAVEKQQDQQSGKTAAEQAQQLSTANQVTDAYNKQADAAQAYTDAQRKASEDIAKAKQDEENADQALADAQRTSSNDIINATQAVARAKQDESRAEQTAAQNNENALHAEQQAEQQLSDAQMAATRAQTALTDARQAASRSIEDLQHRVADDALSVQAATLNIQQAQVDLNKTLSDPAATMLQREQAQLNYQQQVQQLSDIQLQYQRAQEDSAKASAAGVDGAQQVISAQDSLVQAQQRVSDATNTVAEDQEKIVTVQQQGAQAIADAQQKIADSQRALTTAQIDGSERVTKATQAEKDAQQKLDDTYISTGESVHKALEEKDSAARAVNVTLAQQRAQVESLNSAYSVYQNALDKLAPSAQAAVMAFNAVTGPKSPFENLHLDVQQRMFAGLGQTIHDVADKDFPVLRTGMDGMADAINHGAHAIGDFLTAPENAKDWEDIFTNVDTAAGNLSDTIKPILQIITDITDVGSEFLPGISSDFRDMAQRAADFIHQARESGRLKEWIQDGINAFKELWQLVKNVFDIIKDLAGTPGQTGLLTFLKDITGLIRWILDNVPGATYVVDGLVMAWGVIRFISPIGKIVDAISGLISKIKEWRTASDETATANADAAGREAKATEDAAKKTKTAYDDTATAAKNAKTDIDAADKAAGDAATAQSKTTQDAVKDTKTAYADTATASEDSKRRVQEADTAAGAAAEAERDTTKLAATETEAAYAETATAAEGSRTRIVAADAEAGAAAEREATTSRGSGIGIGSVGIGALVAGGVLSSIGTSGPTNEPFADWSTKQKFQDLADTAGKLLSLDVRGVIEKIKQSWDDTVQAQNDATNSLQGNIDKQKSFVDEQQRVTDALHAGDTALDTRRNFMMSSIDGTIRFNDELATAQQAIAQHGRTVDLNTDAGRRNMEQLQQLSDTVMQNLSDMQKNGATQDQVTQKAQYYHDKLDAVAQKLGMTKQQADSYVNALNLIPSNKTTTTHSNVTPMTDLTNQYVHAIKGVPNDWNTTFISNVGVQIAALQDYINHIGYLKNLTPIQTTIDIAQSIPHAIGGIDIIGMAGGGLRTMAAGIADIVPPNTPTLIGDNKTVNESYIPWEVNSRTDEILDATAQALGRTILPRGFDSDVGALSGGSLNLAVSGPSAPLALSTSPQGGVAVNQYVTIQGNVWTEQQLFSQLQTLAQENGVRNNITGVVGYGFGTGR